ncbi:hypothetical protein [Kribbella deserti]|uniref:DUF4352 domain-containing protein n=1 Tax=Kribbella deserti TaxID=1926257 RepID=A0ABV6QZU4_9ACTN
MRYGWFRRNAAALASLVLVIPVTGWWVTRPDYKSWYDAEPRDPVTVAAGGTSYAGATWYAASVEVDPAPKRVGADEPTPPGTTRVRVYLRLQVDDLAKLKGLEGCRVHLRAPDGRIWSDDIASGSYLDRPTGCAGGTDDKPATWRPKGTAEYYLKPRVGKPFETVAVFVVPTEDAKTAQPIVTWATRIPQYLAFPR